MKSQPTAAMGASGRGKAQERFFLSFRPCPARFERQVTQ